MSDTTGPVDGPTPHTVGLAVRIQMLKKGFTGRTLAARIDMPTSTLGRRLTGETEVTVSELIKIAAALGVTPEHLLGEVVKQHAEAADEARETDVVDAAVAA